MFFNRNDAEESRGLKSWILHPVQNTGFRMTIPSANTPVILIPPQAGEKSREFMLRSARSVKALVILNPPQAGEESRELMHWMPRIRSA